MSAPTRDRAHVRIAMSLAFIAATCLFFPACNAQGGNGNVGTQTLKTSAGGLELPAISGGDEVVRHSGYTLSYNEPHEQASWVAYVLRGSQYQRQHVSRTDRFLRDPKVKTGSADNDDYEGSGYDRGHLAPAEDMSGSAQTMRESFYYSNMSPQVPAFNRGVWKRLEELVRFWATAYDSLYVVTGPVLTTGLPAIGPDHVSVPKYYYKVILQYNPAGVRGIGFVLPNKSSLKTLRSFAVPIDSVEKLTGIDFYPKLPDDEEERIESKAVLSDWRWTRTQTR